MVLLMQVQSPEEHVAFSPHTVPQSWQFSGSLFVLVQ